MLLYTYLQNLHVRWTDSSPVVFTLWNNNYGKPSPYNLETDHFFFPQVAHPDPFQYAKEWMDDKPKQYNVLSIYWKRSVSELQPAQSNHTMCTIMLLFPMPSSYRRNLMKQSGPFVPIVK